MYGSLLGDVSDVDEGIGGNTYDCCMLNALLTRSLVKDVGKDLKIAGYLNTSEAVGFHYLCSGGT